MADKPEDLLQRLERLGQDGVGNYGMPICAEAAAELRRLVAENERLHQINQSHEMKLSVRGYEIQIAELEAVNQELREALRVASLALAHATETVPVVYDDDYNRVSAAIAKAEGEKT
jgi:hypothetical protein